jgi:hypothetical protein
MTETTTTMSNEQRLKVQAQGLRDLERRIEQAALLLDTYATEKKRLEREVLPALFHEAGLRSIKLEDGSTITLSMMAEGTLPKEPEQRKAALEWLAANGFENLIECKVTGSWARGERAVAQAEFDRLTAMGNAKVQIDEGIHPMTLGARIRDRVVAGLETPLTLLGVSVFSRARFTKRKNQTMGTAHDDQ